MLVLASNSPRRRQLLAVSGWEFIISPAQVDESVHPGEQPEAYVRRLSLSKAEAVRHSLGEYVPSDAVIVAADTAVVNPLPQERGGFEPGFEILGKPADAAEAERMLRSLRGRSHQVFTALAALRLSDGAIHSEVCVTDVPMRDYNDKEMIAYIQSGDPMDKAGAYAIQHAAFKPVQNLHGCFANVMGLPLCHLVRLLERLGIYAHQDVPQRCQETLDYACPVYPHILGDGHPLAG